MSGGYRLLHLIAFGFLARGLIACGLWSASACADSEPRVALVIGNSNYGEEIGNLANPANDAKLMATTLRKIGFDVIELENADQKQMRRAIVDFGDALAKAGNTATGLFYYAGHGLQVGGDNYLIPLNADINREGDVDVEAVPSDLVLKQMDFAGNAVNIVILDACRNNPLSRGFRSQVRGLAEEKVKPRGSFIAYSTAPGAVAADGAGDNSPYTIALSQAILKPGAGIEEVFRDVRGRVMAATQQKQVPWDSSSLTAPFYFIPPREAPAAEVAAPAAAPTADKSIEIAYWNSIANSTNQVLFQSYLKRFPNGDFTDIAQAKLAELQEASGTAKTRSQDPAPEEGSGAMLSSADKQIEVAYWTAIASSSDGALFQSYLDRYPAGDFATIAKAKLAELQPKPAPTTQQQASATPPPAPAAMPTAVSPPAPAPLPVAGKSFRDCSDCPEMVTVPPGGFVMGAAAGEDAPYSSEEPQHRETIGKAFAAGKFEVTIGEFRAFIEETAFDAGNTCFSDPSGSGNFANNPGINWQNPGFPKYRPSERDPVVCVSWDAAQAYARWLSVKTGKDYRLLTETEWEYADRAGTTTLFPWGGDPNAACGSANVADAAVRRTPGWMSSYSSVACNDQAAYTAPVGRYKANAFGLYDMIGNVNEWVADCYMPGYVGAPADGSVVDMQGCQQRSVRGGGWSSSPFFARSAARTYAPPAARLNVDGFRIARTL